MRKSVLLLTMMLALSSKAATTGTLLIRGNVPALLSIVVTPDATNAINLPLTSSQTDLQIGTVAETSNHSIGYRVTISSANNGNLKRQGGNEVIPYTIKYGSGSSISLSSSQQITYSNAQAHNTVRDVKISYSAVPSTQANGDYEDTLTFTIAVN